MPVAATLGARPQTATVPFLGNSVYRSSYRGASAAQQKPLQALALPSTTIPFEGRSFSNSAHQPFAHLPGTEYEHRHDRPAPQLQPKQNAPFEGSSTHVSDYPPHAGLHAAQSARRPQVAAAAGVPFDAATTYQDVHRWQPGTKRPTPSFTLAGKYDRLPDNRDFSTTQSVDYVPKPLESDAICPAARLPSAPQPQDAPQAWDDAQQHVLWDTKRGTWAL